MYNQSSLHSSWMTQMSGGHCSKNKLDLEISCFFPVYLNYSGLAVSSALCMFIHLEIWFIYIIYFNFWEFLFESFLLISLPFLSADIKTLNDKNLAIQILLEYCLYFLSLMVTQPATNIMFSSIFLLKTNWTGEAFRTLQWVL